MVALVLLVSPFEEVYYRAFIFGALKKMTGVVLAVIIVTGWFTLVHVQQLWEDPIGIPCIMIMGATWTILRHRTGSLVPSIVSHWTYNTLLVVIALLTA